MLKTYSTRASHSTSPRCAPIFSLSLSLSLSLSFCLSWSERNMERALHALVNCLLAVHRVHSQDPGEKTSSSIAPQGTLSWSWCAQRGSVRRVLSIEREERESAVSLRAHHRLREGDGRNVRARIHKCVYLGKGKRSRVVTAYTKFVNELEMKIEIY